MGNFFSDIMAGGIEGAAKGIGQLAKDVRTAVTGNEAMTAQQQADILARADAIEALGAQLEVTAAQGQIDINKLDAGGGSIFKGGWRPAIGWVCAVGLGYTFLMRPLLPWAVQTFCVMMELNMTIPMMPNLDTGELMSLVFAMLGFGGMRMVERIKGVS